MLRAKDKTALYFRVKVAHPPYFGLLPDANFSFCFSITASIHFLMPLSVQSLRALSILSISALIIATSSGVIMTRSFTFTTVRSELPKATFSKAGKAGLLKREGI